MLSPEPCPWLVVTWDCSVHATLLTNPEALTPILTIYLFSFCHCHLFAVHILPAHLFNCFIHSLLAYLPPILLFIFIHCLPTCSVFFFPCLSAYSAVYSFLACPVGSAHLFSCFFPCLSAYSAVYSFLACLPSGQCPPVQLFIHSLPSRVVSRLFIPSCPPVQLFIYSFPPTYSAIY
jgi:hypothetical protein